MGQQTSAGPCVDGGRVRAIQTRQEIDRLGDAELLGRFAAGIENFDRRVVKLTDEQLDQAWLPEAGVGRWPARVVLGHLADAELVFAHRMRRAVAEENPVLANWDENAFVEGGLYGGRGAPIGAFLATMHTLRRWTAEWLSTLTPEQMARKGLHPERGAQSVRDILVYAVWHLEHHAAFLNAKIGRLLGPAPVEEAPAGGCGPNCGCRKG